ncbi:response regulator transcription factor [Streptococcus zalophi]|uniref:Response regulator n=1 Tax=Streptococcus zalophi TaxID=640031 RepID=A0A934PAP3_9STRE|nr:response regulator [Streptococcus zalophi]MBJ8349926.1 response regulator [Streptococcus zalophi]MCR8966920.1 response regulator [Streptococcus zalophi]
MYSLLIVEDEPLVRRGIRSLVDFEKLSITCVDEAENGQEAWQLFEEKHYDIILTDINMPVMNGIQLAQLIKENSPQTHIVFLTGYDDFDYALSALKLGADDYLLKPFSKEDVLQILHQIIPKIEQAKKKTQLESLMEQSPQSEIEQLIQDQLSDVNLSLKSLAKQLSFSPNYLSVLIKKDLGMSFQDYLIQERLKKAKRLLLTTHLKIYEIAEQVGFEDMNYFSQRFKQIVGVTPSQFKKGEQ